MGHAKNFSPFHSRGGVAHLYDILGGALLHWPLADCATTSSRWPWHWAIGGTRMDKILPHHQQTVAQSPIPAALLTQAMTEIAAAGHTALAAATP